MSHVHQMDRPARPVVAAGECAATPAAKAAAAVVAAIPVAPGVTVVTIRHRDGSAHLGVWLPYDQEAGRAAG